jgi:hypothetical protein
MGQIGPRCRFGLQLFHLPGIFGFGDPCHYLIHRHFFLNRYGNYFSIGFRQRDVLSCLSLANATIGFQPMQPFSMRNQTLRLV